MTPALLRPLLDLLLLLFNFTQLGLLLPALELLFHPVLACSRVSATPPFLRHGALADQPQSEQVL